MARNIIQLKEKLSYYTEMTEFILPNNPKHIKYKENRANLSYE